VQGATGDGLSSEEDEPVSNPGVRSREDYVTKASPQSVAKTVTRLTKPVHTANLTVEVCPLVMR
jgi:hypothetical protein